MSPRPGQELVITEIVGRTPVGLNVEQTCASVRAGIARFAEHEYYDTIAPDPDWDEPEPLLCASVPDVDPFMDYQERLEALARPLLGELIGRMNLKRSDLPRLAVLLALPEDDPPISQWNLGQEFLPALLRSAGLDQVGMLAANQEGQTGVFSLLRTAGRLLTSGQVDQCIVGGLDSYLLEDRMEYRDQKWRLRSDRTVDGFIPGEACVMLLVETRGRAEARGAVIRGLLGAPGTGQEVNTYSGDLASSGRGLIEALRLALPDGGPASMPPWVVCDLNGESYRHAEWALLETRLPEALSRVQQVVRPVESVGDIGAATGALLLACVCEAFKRGYNPASEAMVWTAADDGKRVALKVKQVNRTSAAFPANQERTD
jgi:3-oxoacyl-[acyl-carrier-protein] synthase I